MKLTKKQIDTIILYTPAELRGQPVQGWTGIELGYYSPANANWAYHAQYIEYNGVPIPVITQFGHIV